jgi:sec-independent protein translocase protein TatA
MVEQPNHNTTRPILTPSTRIRSCSSWRRAVWDHRGTIRVQRRLMNDEASGGLPVIGSPTHDTEERIMGGLGMQELLIILVIALLFFGGKKLPELASGMGKAVREFKRASTEPERTDVHVKELTEPASPDETVPHRAPN